MSDIELIATTAFGLEAVAARELKHLGLEGKGNQPGRILFRGDEAAICRSNLWLRSADRVMIRLGHFPATDFGALFDQTFALPWERWLPRDAEFPVNGRSLQSQLSSVPACQRIVKKAIAKKLLAAHRTNELPETGAKFTIDLSLLKDEVTLCIDTTGPSLHKRGYRQLTAQAPLKETMAAAMILLSFWRPERPLLDPFCGSGTIPIEAALIGQNRAPGLHRKFDAERWPTIPQRCWQEARRDALAAVRTDTELQIIGTDQDEQVLRMARFHADKAEVADSIHFQRKSFADVSSKRKYGCLICNPPYGERIGEDQEVESLYQSMPIVFQGLETWSFYVLTSHPDFENIIQRQADRRRKLYNGRIQCTYFQYHGPRPPK